MLIHREKNWLWKLFRKNEAYQLVRFSALYRNQSNLSCCRQPLISVLDEKKQIQLNKKSNKWKQSRKIQSKKKDWISKFWCIRIDKGDPSISRSKKVQSATIYSNHILDRSKPKYLHRNKPLSSSPMYLHRNPQTFLDVIWWTKRRSKTF